MPITKVFINEDFRMLQYIRKKEDDGVVFLAVTAIPDLTNLTLFVSNNHNLLGFEPAETDDNIVQIVLEAILEQEKIERLLKN